MKYIPYIPSFFRMNIINDVEFCQSLFLYLLRWSCDLHAGFRLYAVLHLLICISWPVFDKTNLIMVYDFYMCCLIQVASSSKRFVCNSFLLLSPCLVLEMSIIWPHRISLIMFLHFLVDEEVWQVLVLVLLQRFHRIW
jgi:hypothetical protein